MLAEVLWWEPEGVVVLTTLVQPPTRLRGCVGASRFRVRSGRGFAVGISCGGICGYGSLQGQYIQRGQVW